MPSFDGNDYRKRVLARLLADNGPADPETGDPFLVCDVDPDASDAQVAERLGEVVAFWQRERSHPRYKGIAAMLVSRRAAYEAILLDPAARAAARDRVYGAREEQRGQAVAELDRLAAALTARYHGIPRSRVPRLEQAALRRGIDKAAFDAWLTGQHVVGEADESVSPWESGLRRQVRAALDELASLTGDRARHRTLWTLLGLAPGADTATVAARYDVLLGENQAGRHDRVRTLTGDLLGHVKTRLMVDGGPESYEASIRADARDAITHEVEELGLVAGELTAADVATLTARVVGWSWGIAGGEARDIVTGVAAAHGIAVAIGGDVHLVVCARCRNPQPAAEHCRYCGAELFVACPSCAARIEAAAHICPRCRTDLAAFHEQRARERELLAAMPVLPAPENVLVRTEQDGVTVSWEPPTGVPVKESYEVRRGDVVLGRMDGTSYTDESAPVGVPMRYEVVLIAGERRSDPAASGVVTWLRDVAGAEASTTPDGRVEVTWPPVPAGDVVLERTVADDSIRAPSRRIRPTEPGRYVDPDARPGTAYRYRVFVEYDLPQGRRATRGVTVIGQVRGAAPAASAAAPPVTALAARHTAGGVLLTFDWPVGVTEARVVWRPDRPPVGPEDGSVVRITNARMEIEGGCLVPAHGPVFLAVFPLVRPSPGAQPTPVTVSAAHLRVT